MAFASCVSRTTETAQQPVLHVEARVKSNEGGIIVRTDLVCRLSCGSRIQVIHVSLILTGNKIRDEVTQWLIDNFVVLTLGQEINSFGNMHHFIREISCKLLTAE